MAAASSEQRPRRGRPAPAQHRRLEGARLDRVPHRPDRDPPRVQDDVEVVAEHDALAGRDERLCLHGPLVGYAGAVVGPPLVGLLADAVGLRAAFAVVPAAALVMAVLAARS